MPMEPEVRLNLPKKNYKKGDLPDSKEGWVEYVNKCHGYGLEQRKKYELQWAVNTAYYKGYQNLIFDPVMGILQLARENIQPIMVNRIGAFVEARHAKLTKNRPTSRVIPNTTDRADINAAKYSDQALMHLWRKIDMESQYDRGVMQMLLCGTSFMKNVWDPLSGDTIEEDSIDDDNIVEVIEEGIKRNKIFMGEVSSKPISAFGLLPASDAIPDIKDQPWMLERPRVPIAEIEKRFPHLRGKVMPEGLEESTTEYERLIMRMASQVFSGYGTGGPKKGNKQSLDGCAVLKGLWVAPNYQYEEGVVVMVCGKELAFIDKFPNDYGDNVYPFVKMYEKEDGFNFWNQSTIERLIPVQRAINTIKQKKIKNAVLMANGKWMNPTGSQVPEEAFTDEEGEVIPYNPAVPEPHQAQISSLPNYVQALDAELVTDFRDVAGQRETSVTPTPNLTAGVAMQIQAELADEVLNPIIRRLSRSMEKTANQQLLLIDQEWIEPRKVQIIGTKGPMAVQWMKNADFRHHTDVHIEIDSMFPEFRGQKIQKLLDLWDRRIITDPKQIIEAMRFGNFDSILDKQEEIDDMLYLDIQKIKKGQAPEFSPFQNHSEYAKKLIEFINTPEFLRLIPERKSLAIQVAQQHLQFLMAQMPEMGQPVEQQNQAAVGTPFGPSVPAGAQ